MKLVGFTTVLVALLGVCSVVIADEPAPLLMKNGSVGGAALNQYTPGVENGTGTNNIGLLIKTCGKVTFVDATNKYFYINDGSARSDGSGHVGLRVRYDNLAAGNTLTPPSLDSYVAITGISGTIAISGKVQSSILPRRQTDVQPVSP